MIKIKVKVSRFWLIKDLEEDIKNLDKFSVTYSHVRETLKYLNNTTESEIEVELEPFKS